jgi:hypothetical protein
VDNQKDLDDEVMCKTRLFNYNGLISHTKLKGDDFHLATNYYLLQISSYQPRIRTPNAHGQKNAFERKVWVGGKDMHRGITQIRLRLQLCLLLLLGV